MMQQAGELLNILSGEESGENPTRLLLGTIPASYSGSGRPQVQFDGETSPSTRKYRYLSTYSPKAGDRVLVVCFGVNSKVILGALQ